MRYLVTGAAGFIGAAVSDALLARGDSVIGIDSLNDYYQVQLKRDRIARIEARATEGAFRFAQVDFADHRALDEALSGEEFDRIIHLGAQAGVRYSLENPRAYVDSNVMGHVNLLEVARHRGVDHMVYASSSSVYGGADKVPFSVDDRVDHPLSLYAATKKADELMSETYAHLYRIPLTGLRFFTVYGPWGRPDMMMWIFTGKILAGEPIPVFNHGEMWRDFTYIDDIVAGVLAAADHPPADDGTVKAGGSVKPHALYNIGNHVSEKLTDVIALLEEACGRKAEIELLPMQPGDVPRTFADIDAIRRDLGYEPTTSVDVGVPRFVAWYRDYHGL
ncbi:NAD-dependent epimerase/dehydratase family protein [Alteraurantiacibacter aquimixticola]|uniref:NAD-dependent epimerase/dehydratase family protein n=1 Tax=Alteraurantiacibacter aquimixticola TaxID=2489173 RepID=A0A4T3F179_9SPHN|nr:NAD-dependent epimerase/dehydratase family protein [Alteraurantiacibacter aquimixticola]TIX50025.1 NAD-dependent epimerase/dehydratase family protein [Alteraurantiacibacter aquimixticola]